MMLSHQRTRIGSIKKHKNNIVRLELGKQFSEDNASNNCYTRAAKFLRNGLIKTSF